MRRPEPIREVVWAFVDGVSRVVFPRHHFKARRRVFDRSYSRAFVSKRLAPAPPARAASMPPMVMRTQTLTIDEFMWRFDVP